MKKWEYIVAYVGMTEDFQFEMQVGKEVISGKQVWQHINSLGINGWELVSVVERIGNLPNIGSKVATAGAVFGAMMMGQPTSTVRETTHRAATLGYFYHFKREIPVD